jgi:hypothetical protein
MEVTLWRDHSGRPGRRRVSGMTEEERGGWMDVRAQRTWPLARYPKGGKGTVDPRLWSE